MLANNTSYEISFTTCHITPENHGSLLGSLFNMQLASRNPFSGQIFFAKFTGPPPPTCTLTFARSFAQLSWKYPYSQTPAISRGCTEGKAKTRGLGVWLSQSTFGNLAYCYSHFLMPFSCRTPGGSGWQPFTYNDYNTQLSRNFREIKFYFRELEKKAFARVSNITCTAFAIKTPYKDL